MTTNQESIIVSIPHSGTRFLQKRLGVEKYVHTITNWDALYERIKRKKIISPLRSPPDVWASWARRRNPKTEPFPYVSFCSAWYVMHTLDMLFDIDFICIDKQCDPRITDWTPIGNDDYGDYKRPTIDLRPLYKLPFVRKHYGSWQRPTPTNHLEK